MTLNLSIINQKRSSSALQYQIIQNKILVVLLIIYLLFCIWDIVKDG